MTDGSITRLIGQVKEGGDSLAEQEIWNHYFSRLTALARKKLQELPPHLRDDEDLALSALTSFFARAKRDDFPLLHDRTDLWQLLAKITVRKTYHRRRNAHAQKRGGGQGGSDFAAELRALTAQEPTPDMLAAINEQCQHLLALLNPNLKTVAQMKLQGYTNREIATSLGRVERTVERKLERIRCAWSKEVERP